MVRRARAMTGDKLPPVSDAADFNGSDFRMPCSGCGAVSPVSSMFTLHDAETDEQAQGLYCFACARTSPDSRN